MKQLLQIRTNGAISVNTENPVERMFGGALELILLTTEPQYVMAADENQKTATVTRTTDKSTDIRIMVRAEQLDAMIVQLNDAKGYLESICVAAADALNKSVKPEEKNK